MKISTEFVQLIHQEIIQRIVQIKTMPTLENILEFLQDATAASVDASDLHWNYSRLILYRFIQKIASNLHLAKITASIPTIELCVKIIILDR